MESEVRTIHHLNETVDNQSLPSIDRAQLPAIISEQSTALSTLSSKVDRAKSKADAAYEAVKDMQEFKDGKFLGWKFKKGDTKEIIQGTQNVIKQISDAQKDSAEALRLSFLFNAELAKASEYLFSLGSFNMATNEAMIQDLYNVISSKGKTKTQLPEIIKQKYIEVAKRLKEQQNILIKQSDLENKIADIKANTVSLEAMGQARKELESNISERAQEARDAAIKTAAEALGQAKLALETQISEKASEAREAAIKTASESLGHTKKELDTQITQKAKEARETAIKTAFESLGEAKVELETQIAEKTNEARESAIKTASNSLGQAKTELGIQISEKTKEARESAIKTATETLGQAKMELETRISEKAREARESATKTAADELGHVKIELETKISEKTNEARDAAIKTSAENVTIIRNEIEDTFSRRIEKAITTSELKSANLLDQNIKTIKKRIVTSYIVGGLGLTGAITTLVLNLLNVI